MSWFFSKANNILYETDVFFDPNKKIKELSDDHREWDFLLRPNGNFSKISDFKIEDLLHHSLFIGNSNRNRTNERVYEDNKFLVGNFELLSKDYYLICSFGMDIHVYLLKEYLEGKKINKTMEKIANMEIGSLKHRDFIYYFDSPFKKVNSTGVVVYIEKEQQYEDIIRMNLTPTTNKI